MKTNLIKIAFSFLFLMILLANTSVAQPGQIPPLPALP